MLRVYLRRSLPTYDGRIAVGGITAPVEIVRDRDAIPHIFGATKLDALFGLGYVHAQDRLWQMEFQRRIGNGRLSEIFGTSTIPQDRFLRTVGFGRAARATWSEMPPWAQEQVNAYVAGINAFIATHHGSQLPPEFSLLRFEPEPWSGNDVAVWVKMMAWDLSGNYAFELLRHDLARTVGLEGMAQLMPPYPLDGPSIVSDADLNAPGSPFHPRHSEHSKHSAKGTPEEQRGSDDGPRTRDQGLQSSSWLAATESSLAQGNDAVRDMLLGGATTESLGSNNWVVDGSLTASGKPVLANDPHLDAHIPSIWYLAHVSAGDFDIIGATLPGAPAVALGRNKAIAWGATNVSADVEDLYRERLDPTGRFAEFRGAREPITTIPETIVVKGAKPIQFGVRVTRHGPLVSDAINANNAEIKSGPRPEPLEPLAFRWTALDHNDSTVPAYLRLNEAHNWEQFVAALRDYVVPSQNFVYADVDGHIGYYAPGHFPIRASGDGSRPAEGWSGEAEWTGWIPFGELPHLYDPPTHFIVTANHRPAPPSYPYVLGLEWPEPYRAQRITELIQERIGSGAKLALDDSARIQADTLSLHARALLPLLLAHVHPQGPMEDQAVAALRGWNMNATADSLAETVFEAWFYHLAPTLVTDELGAVVTDSYKRRLSYVTRFVVNTLTRNNSAWCDDRTTAKQETCDDAVTEAFRRGLADLSSRMGADMSRWRWDTVHHAIFPHQGLDTIAILRPFLSRSVPNGGDWSTVDVGSVVAEQPFEQHSVPGFREIIDLSSARDDRFVDAVGESGHPLSPHYDDFQADWRAVRYRRMRTERSEIEQGAIGHLTLVPK